jgi:hypothetical protein
VSKHTAESSADPPQSAARLVIGAQLLVMLLALPVYLYRVYHNRGGCDFVQFYDAGRNVLETHTRLPRSLLHFYLPSLDVAWAAIACMPLILSAVLYYLFSCGTWLGVLAATHRYLLPSKTTADGWLMAAGAGLLTLVFTVDHLLLAAFHLLMVWLMVAGIGRVLSGRTASGAGLLGIAIWLKLLPLLAAVYLLLKRRWTAAAACVAIAIAIDLGLSLVGYGAEASRKYHVQWWHEQAVGKSRSLLESPKWVAELRDRNQSLPAVLRRLFGQIEPPPSDTFISHVHLATLSPAGLRKLYWGLSAVIAGLLVWLCRRPATRLLPRQRAAEISWVVLATVWFSPIVLSYHPVAAIPALAVLLGSPPGRSVIKRSVLLIWIAAVILLGVPVARAAGEALWATLAVGAAVALTCRGSRSAQPSLDST